MKGIDLNCLHHRPWTFQAQVQAGELHESLGEKKNKCGAVSYEVLQINKQTPSEVTYLSLSSGNKKHP